MICPRFNFQRHCELTSYNLKLENSFSQSLPLLKKLLWLFMVTAIRFTCEVKIQTNDLSYQISNCSLCTSYQHEYFILPLKLQAFSPPHLSSPSSSHLEVLHFFLLRQILHSFDPRPSFLPALNTVTPPSLTPLAFDLLEFLLSSLHI